MGTAIEFGPTEFEQMLGKLNGLTRAQIAELVMERIAPEDVASYSALSEALSLEALRFLSARTLFRLRRR